MKKRAMARIAAYAATVLAATALAGVTSPLQASDPVSVESIVDALKKRKTRSVGVPVRPPRRLRLRISNAFARHAAGISTTAPVWQKRHRTWLRSTWSCISPSNSSEIQKESEPVLDMLGQALSNDEYKGRSFVLAGHTDTKGTADYNQRLSERRSEAVKSYIVRRFKLSSDDLLKSPLSVRPAHGTVFLEGPFCRLGLRAGDARRPQSGRPRRAPCRSERRTGGPSAGPAVE